MLLHLHGLRDFSHRRSRVVSRAPYRLQYPFPPAPGRCSDLSVGYLLYQGPAMIAGAGASFAFWLYCFRGWWLPEHLFRDVRTDTIVVFAPTNVRLDGFAASADIRGACARNTCRSPINGSRSIASSGGCAIGGADRCGHRARAASSCLVQGCMRPAPFDWGWFRLCTVAAPATLRRLGIIIEYGCCRHSETSSLAEVPSCAGATGLSSHRR